MPVDVTVYLPDRLGTWAKEHELGLSRMLRDAVEDEKRRREAAADTLKGAETHDLTVENADGRAYTARLHGVQIAKDRDVWVYLGEDEEVYVYDTHNQDLHQKVDPSGLRDWLTEGPYVEAMEAIGEPAVIDVGLPE
jgi:hypothetical protein